MRSSHGGSRGNPCLAIVPGGNDFLTRSEDVEGGPEVGEVGYRIVEVRSTDGDSFTNTGWGDVARVLSIVSGGCDNGDTGIEKLKMESLVSGAATASVAPLDTYRPNSIIDGVRSTAA